MGIFTKCLAAESRGLRGTVLIWNKYFTALSQLGLGAEAFPQPFRSPVARPVGGERKGRTFQVTAMWRLRDQSQQASAPITIDISALEHLRT